MADNTPVTAGLIMDRGTAIGNSEGDDNRGRLHVKVNNKQTEPIPVNLIDDEPGTPIFFSSQNLTAPGAELILITQIVSSTKINLTKLKASCRREAIFYIKINSNIIGSARTGPGSLNVTFDWTPRIEALNGETIEVTVKAMANMPITDCEAYLMGLSI